MSGIKVVLEQFVVGDLDFANLERELAGGAAVGETRETALEALEQLTRRENLSSAVTGLLRRAIDRHFAMDDTDPFPRIRPSVERGRAADDAEAEDTDPGMPAIYPTETVDTGTAPEAPAADAPAPPPEPGSIIAGRYELERLIGRGGSGLVYRAVDRCRLAAGSEEPRVALKILKPELARLEEALRRLMAEGVRGAELRHENLVRAIDVGNDDGLCFVTMELLEGDTLRSTITRHSPEGLPRDEALDVLAGITRGLACLHGRGLVHGDLKPGNIFLTREGIPKLLDFGTAAPGRHGREPSLEAAGPPGRTPAYASPEVMAGEAPRFSDDIFALACVACELLSSKHPYGRTPADEARDQNMKPVLPASLSGSRRRTLAAALRFDGTRRPQDAAAFLAGMDLETKQRGRAGILLAALAGLGAGILLVLGIISPGGPLGRLLPKEAREMPPTPVETAIEPASLPQAARRDPAAETRPAAVDAGGSFVPETPVASVEQAPAATEPEALSSDASGQEGAPPPVPENTPESGPAEESVAVSAPEPARAPAPVVPEGPGRLAFAADGYRVTEGTAVVIATISRQGGTSGDVTVRWRTVSASAEAEADFVGSDWEVVTIADGDDSVRVYVPLVDDGLAEDEESFFLELAGPGGGATLGSPARIRVRISDDERTP